MFTTGPNELAEAPEGPRACVEVETPRCIIGLSLLAVGLIGLFGAAELPASSGRDRSRYTQPRSQRRALKRSI